jgi:hypothetical protein
MRNRQWRGRRWTGDVADHAAVLDAMVGPVGGLFHIPTAAASHEAEERRGGRHCLVVNG